MKVVGVIMAQQCSSVWQNSEHWQRSITRAAACLAQCSPDGILINQNRFADGYVPDIYPGQGLLSAVHAAAYHRPEHHLLCISPDMPGLDGPLLRWLAATGKSARRSCHYQHHALPLFVHNSASMRQRLEQRLTSDEPVLTDNLALLDCVVIVAPEPDKLKRITDGPF